MKTKNKILFSVLALIVLISLTYTVMADVYSACPLNVSIASQDPSPAVPGEYVKIIFQISGINNSNCDGAKFGLMPEYPFSLDNNESMRILESYLYAPGNREVWTLTYKIRVDENAVSGDTDLKVRYAGGHHNVWNSYSTKIFTIGVQDSRTSFDAVIQETSGSEVSIAIANTGKYTANSMIARIPEQENFQVSGTNGQMVGNLESGDYTIVSFAITQNIQRNAGAMNRTGQNLPTADNNLKVQIDYTDGIGERRTSILEIPLQINSFSTNSTVGAFPAGFGARRQANSSIFSKWYTWVIIAFLLLLGFGFYNKYKTRIKNFFRRLKDKSEKKSHEEKSSETPEWVKKEKAKMKG
jgi:hypothetical protein